LSLAGAGVARFFVFCGILLAYRIVPPPPPKKKSFGKGKEIYESTSAAMHLTVDIVSITRCGIQLSKEGTEAANKV
jgi:hypothetical protein